jgi:hypothetical protein
MSDPSPLDAMLQSASAEVTEEDIAAAQDASEKMKQHSDSLDMLQHRMFAADDSQ